MDSTADSPLSFADGPFPVSVLAADGTIRQANNAWQTLAEIDGLAWDVLGLIDSDRIDFADTVALVAQERTPAWIDLEADVLKERRWARCHIWPSRDTSDVIVAVIALRESRDIGLSRVETDHIERILEHTADAITIVGDDMSFRFASGIATRWLGMSGSALEGHNSLSFVFPDDHHILIDAFAQCIEKPRLSVKARFRVVHESGDLIWVEAIGTNMFADPAIRGILVTLNDITELVEARAAAEENKAALQIEKQRYETLAQFMPTGVFELDADNHLTFRNERFTQLTGLPASSEFSWTLFDERDAEALQAALGRARAGAAIQSTVRLARDVPEHDERWLTIRAVRQGGSRILATVEDSTSQITKQAELAHRADHDYLTGLPNRESLLEQLEELTAAGEAIAVPLHRPRQLQRHQRRAWPPGGRSGSDRDCRPHQRSGAPE